MDLIIPAVHPPVKPFARPLAKSIGKAYGVDSTKTHRTTSAKLIATSCRTHLAHGATPMPNHPEHAPRGGRTALNITALILGIAGAVLLATSLVAAIITAAGNTYTTP